MLAVSEVIHTGWRLNRHKTSSTVMQSMLMELPNDKSLSCDTGRTADSHDVSYICQHYLVMVFCVAA
jgi:hypothetical protein